MTGDKSNAVARDLSIQPSAQVSELLAPPGEVDRQRGLIPAKPLRAGGEVDDVDEGIDTASQFEQGGFDLPQRRFRRTTDVLRVDKERWIDGSVQKVRLHVLGDPVTPNRLLDLGNDPVAQGRPRQVGQAGIDA